MDVGISAELLPLVLGTLNRIRSTAHYPPSPPDATACGAIMPG